MVHKYSSISIKNFCKMPNLHVFGIDQLGTDQPERKQRPGLDLILCYYINQSAQLQILRSATMKSWRFEQVVFPKERLLFKAPAMAHLNVHEVIAGTSVFLTTLDCYGLRVQTKTQKEVHLESQIGAPCLKSDMTSA
jgi:hypothetical protein